MPAQPEPFATDAYPQLPYPPAVTRRRVPLTVADDAVLMPPFSGRSLRAPGFLGAAPRAEWAAPAVSAGAMEASPLPVASELRLELAEEVAGRLESMASDLRRRGFNALLEPRSQREPIDVVLASVIAGFLARR